MKNEAKSELFCIYCSLESFVFAVVWKYGVLAVERKLIRFLKEMCFLFFLKPAI